MKRVPRILLVSYLVVLVVLAAATIAVVHRKNVLRKQEEQAKREFEANAWDIRVTVSGQPTVVVRIDKRGSDVAVNQRLHEALRPLFTTVPVSSQPIETGYVVVERRGGSFDMAGKEKVTVTSTIRIGPYHVIGNVDGKPSICGIRFDNHKGELKGELIGDQKSMEDLSRVLCEFMTPFLREMY